jgi:hypothetical protein
MTAKILGIIFVFLAFAAIISGIYYWQTGMAFPPQFPIHQSATETFINTEKTFQVTYLNSYSVNGSQTNQSNYFNKNGTTIVTINIPQSTFPNTNFVEDYLTIAEGKNLAAADCDKYLSSSGKVVKLDKTEKINGNAFSKAEFSGAAAGNFYETKLYRIFHDKTCYEISLTLHTGNIGNYPTGSVIEVNKDEAWFKLDLILQTFKFSEQVSDINNNQDTDNTDPTDGTLSGHVTIASPAPDIYDLTQVIVYTADRSKIVTKASLNSTGDYEVSIPSGNYYVTYSSINTLIQPPMKKITVIMDETTTADFTIDSNTK